ncbi:hypothetical protein ACWFM6_16360, partial [Bacillus altitudinis]
IKYFLKILIILTILHLHFFLYIRNVLREEYEKRWVIVDGRQGNSTSNCKTSRKEKEGNFRKDKHRKK